MRYIRPKADITFNRVFGEHPDIVISFLNGLLPLADDEQIVEIEYLTAEMMPEIPLREDSFVNVSCKDSGGRQFLVQILLDMFAEFHQYVKLNDNDSKAYLRPLASGDDYKIDTPIYSLNLIHEAYDVKLEGYYHHYPIVQIEYSEKVIEGLQIVLIELPKFRADCSHEDRSLRTLWLRFLEEITEKVRYAPDELLAVPEINKAVDCLEKYKFSDGEICNYVRFWETVSYQISVRAAREGLYKKHFELGRAREIARKRIEEKFKMARNLKAMSMSYETICKVTGLSIEDIERC